MATPTPEELQKQFEKLQRLALTLGKDLNNFNLGPLAQDAALVEELVEKWNDELKVQTFFTSMAEHIRENDYDAT